MSGEDQVDSSSIPSPAGCGTPGAIPAPFTTSPTPTTVGSAQETHVPRVKAPASARRKRPVQLPERIGLSYTEVNALLGVPERSLRRMVSTKRVHRSVLRFGKRGVRFLRDVLVEELREGVS